LNLEKQPSRASILVVDDDPICRELLKSVLEILGYRVETACDGLEALDLVYSGDFRIVLSDWQMPGLSGIELCQRIRKRQLGGYVYFILLTCLSRKENLVVGLRAGADDFINKPFDPEELQVRLRAAERIISLEGRDLLIFSLAKLAELRDPETGAHLERMREYVRILAQQLSTHPAYANVIDADYVRTIYMTSPLHDIGKVGIPDRVLLKPGKLTADEFEVMKQHVLIGSHTLEAALGADSSAQYLRFGQEIVLSHHEKFDGTGYPYGLSGDRIPLCGRIVALADVYDALTTKRVYKDAFSHQKAKSIIIEGAGRHFDPDIVDAFLQREADFIEIREQLDDAYVPPSPGALIAPLLSASPVGSCA
jgi:putative two-component system response regulator